MVRDIKNISNIAWQGAKYAGRLAYEGAMIANDVGVIAASRVMDGSASNKTADAAARRLGQYKFKTEIELSFGPQLEANFGGLSLGGGAGIKYGEINGTYNSMAGWQELTSRLGNTSINHVSGEVDYFADNDVNTFFSASILGLGGEIGTNQKSRINWRYGVTSTGKTTPYFQGGLERSIGVKTSVHYTTVLKPGRGLTKRPNVQSSTGLKMGFKAGFGLQIAVAVQKHKI